MLHDHNDRALKQYLCLTNFLPFIQCIKEQLYQRTAGRLLPFGDRRTRRVAQHSDLI